MADPAPTRVLLQRVSEGSPRARDELLALVYEELKRIARGQMRGDRGAETLQPTALVHEAWLKLMGAGAAQDWNSRQHFFAVAARAMRQVLVDHVRAKRTQKRGGELAREDLELDETVAFLERDETDLLDLDQALLELEQDDPELARLVELRFFAGMSHKELAGVLGCSIPTVERSWRIARARLHRRLDPG